MAIDAQILNFLANEKERQSDARMKSSIFMKDTSEILSSIKDSVRYNTTQIASLKSGLGAVTGKILSEMGNVKKNLINKISSKESSIEKPNALIQKKSPIVEKLEEIRRLVQNQRDIIKRYVDKRLEGLQFEGDKTKITGDSKESDQDLASKREIREENAKKEGLNLGKKIAGGALLLAMEPIARIFNFFKGLGPLMRKISSGIKKISTGVRGTLKALSKSLGPLMRKISSGIKKIPTGIRGTLKSLSKSSIKSIKSIGTFLRRSYLSTVKNITSITRKIGGMFSKVGNAIGGLFGKIGGLISKIPGMSLLTKGAKFIGKKTPLISGLFEATDAANIGTMGAEERKEYLGNITDEVAEKGFLGRMWYSLNNNVKVMSAVAQTWSDKNKLEKENEEAEKRILEMQQELANRNEARLAKEEDGVEKIKRTEEVDRTERDRIFLENLRMYEEERMRQMREQELPEAPPYPPQENNNVIINNTNINAPSSDWGQRIRQSATSK